MPRLVKFVPSTKSLRAYASRHPLAVCVLVLLVVLCGAAFAIACTRPRAIREAFRVQSTMGSVGVSYTQPIQQAIHALYSQRNMISNYNKRGGLPLVSSGAALHNMHFDKCEGPGKHRCFLRDNHLAKALEMIRASSFSYLLSNSNPYSAQDFNDESTLLYVDEHGIVHLRQNDARSVSADTARQVASLDGGISRQYSDSDPDAVSCSLGTVTKTNSLYNDGCCKPGRVFRTDLQMCVTPENQCKYPHMGTMPGGFAHEAYKRACAKESPVQTKTCTELYPAKDLLKLYYTPVFPKTLIELHMNIDYINRLRNDLQFAMYIAYDQDTMYAVEPEASNPLSSETDTRGTPPNEAPRVTSIDSSDPFDIWITFMIPTTDPTTGGHAQTTQRLRSLVFLSSKTSEPTHLLKGLLEMSTRDDNAPAALYQFFVTPPSQRMETRTTYTQAAD